MILLFTFNRSNIWPLQDIGLLRAISNNYKKKYFPPKIFLKKLYKKFSPYCSVATWYLWRSIDDEPIQYWNYFFLIWNIRSSKFFLIFPLVIDLPITSQSLLYLSELRQIGRWSAEMILLFTFNRSNIWPLQDIGLLRAISNNYNKKYFPPKSFLNKLYKKFSPYCSVATWYLWRSIDNEPIQY